MNCKNLTGNTYRTLKQTENRSVEGRLMRISGVMVIST